jgi:hypothetical protein
VSADLYLDEWAGPGAKDTEHIPAPGVEPAALHFPTLPAFVAHFVTWYRREVFDSHELTWCPQWWRHPEAVVRLEATWRSFEALRQDPATGISVWLRDHADVHMAQLMSPAGPFRGCHARDGHTSDPLPALPVVDPPAEWWTEADSSL